MIVNVVDAMKKMRVDVQGEVLEFLYVGHGMKLREEENLEEEAIENQIGLSDEQTKTMQMKVLLMELLMKKGMLLKRKMGPKVGYLSLGEM